MNPWLLLTTLIVLSSGCIPSTSITTPVVTTTTVAPTNVTTTTASPNATTTTTVASVNTSTTTTVPTTTTLSTTTPTTTTTTAVPNCCAYPIQITNVNNAMPTLDNWNCNGTITFTCILTSSTDGFVSAGVEAISYPSNRTTIISQDLVNNITVHCDSNTFQWYTSTPTELYSYFTCSYKRSDGTFYTP